MKYKCPCCGYYTFVEKPNGTFDICPVCYWEDDIVQLDDPEYVGGANNISLNQARKNYRMFGACEENMVEHVRKPHKKELNGLDW